MKLKEVAEVSSAGVIKYEEIQVAPLTQEAILLSGSNLLELGYLSLIKDGENANLRKVYVEPAIFEAKRLEAGDVIFMSRGASFRATIVQAHDAELNLIPSPNFTVIKANNMKILPEVVVSFLNSPVGQAKLEGLAVGTAIRNVPVGKLRSLELTLPSLEEQKQLQRLFYKNIEVLEAMSVLYRQQNATFQSVVNNMMGEEIDES